MWKTTTRNTTEEGNGEEESRLGFAILMNVSLSQL